MLVLDNIVCSVCGKEIEGRVENNKIVIIPCNNCIENGIEKECESCDFIDPKDIMDMKMNELISRGLKNSD